MENDFQGVSCGLDPHDMYSVYASNKHFIVMWFLFPSRKECPLNYVISTFWKTCAFNITEVS